MPVSTRRNQEQEALKTNPKKRVKISNGIDSPRQKEDSPRTSKRVKSSSGTTSTSQEQETPNKRIFLNAFDLFAPSHLSFGQWRNPKDKSSTKAKDLDYWTTLAKILERGDITALFLANSYGHYDIYKGNGEPAIRTGSQFPKSDPSIVS
jgi:hypothetical protein